jgi:hypothetical protein
LPSTEIITLSVITEHTFNCKVASIKQRDNWSSAFLLFNEEQNQFFQVKDKDRLNFNKFLSLISVDTHAFQSLNTIACLF